MKKYLLFLNISLSLSQLTIPSNLKEIIISSKFVSKKSMTLLFNLSAIQTLKLELQRNSIKGIRYPTKLRYVNQDFLFSMPDICFKVEQKCVLYTLSCMGRKKKMIICQMLPMNVLIKCLFGLFVFGISYLEESILYRCFVLN